MKKLLSILSLICLTLSSYALTLEEAFKEIRAIEGIKAKKEYVIKNNEELTRLWNSEVKNAEWLLYSVVSDATKEEIAKIPSGNVSVLWSLFVTQNIASLELTDLNIIYSVSYSASKLPGFYERIKMAGFKVAGRPIHDGIIIALANYNKDLDVIKGYLNTFQAFSVYVNNYMAEDVLSMSDLKTAYNFVCELENKALILKSKGSKIDAQIKKIQELQDTLYIRLTRNSKL